MLGTLLAALLACATLLAGVALGGCVARTSPIPNPHPDAGPVDAPPPEQRSTPEARRPEARPLDGLSHATDARSDRGASER